ncbi:MAG: helix-turn-helix transcriptional regulator [Tenuifilaceae bacterium]
MTKTYGDDYREFGTRVTECRRKMRLSQQEAAELLGMPQSTYAGYESGARRVPLSVIKQLAEFFGVTPDHLILGDTDTELIAAHFDGTEFTPEERKEIENYIRYVLSRRQ